jgi:hypothetical protein
LANEQITLTHTIQILALKKRQKPAATPIYSDQHSTIAKAMTLQQ